MHNDEWVVMAPEKRDGQGLATFNHLKLDGYIARQIRVPIETYYLSAWRPKPPVGENDAMQSTIADVEVIG